MLTNQVPASLFLWGILWTTTITYIGWCINNKSYKRLLTWSQKQSILSAPKTAPQTTLHLSPVQSPFQVLYIRRLKESVIEAPHILCLFTLLCLPLHSSLVLLVSISRLLALSGKRPTFLFFAIGHQQHLTGAHTKQGDFPPQKGLQSGLPKHNKAFGLIRAH